MKDFDRRFFQPRPQDPETQDLATSGIESWIWTEIGPAGTRDDADLAMLLPDRIGP